MGYRKSYNKYRNDPLLHWGKLENTATGKDPFLVPKPFLFAKLKQTHELQQVSDQASDTWACEQRLDEVMRTSLTVWITTNYGKVLEDGNARPSYLPPEKPVCTSSSKLELDMEQQIVSKLGKEYVKAVYCHPAYLTYIRVHHAKCRVG